MACYLKNIPAYNDSFYVPYASIAVHYFPICGLEGAGDNQVISHIPFKKLVIAGDKDLR